MKGELSRPKCGGRVRAPRLFADTWQRDAHGPVRPLQPVLLPSVQGLEVVVRRSQVRLWMPWPLPVGWLLTGVGYAGDDAAAAARPPSPARAGAPGRPGERILVAEELGVGLARGSPASRS